MADPVMTKAELLERLSSVRLELLARGVQELGLFGSFVKNKANDQSDIDLLVDFQPECYTFDNFMELSFFLEDLLGRKIELVTRASLSPYIGPRILKEVECVTTAA